MPGGAQTIPQSVRVVCNHPCATGAWYRSVFDHVGGITSFNNWFTSTVLFENNYINFHSFSLIFIVFHWFSFVFIEFHRFTTTFRKCLSWTVVWVKVTNWFWRRKTLRYRAPVAQGWLYTTPTLGGIDCARLDMPRAPRWRPECVITSHVQQ